MSSTHTQPLTRSELTRAWFPLWISWLAMALEFPLIASFVSRLEHPEIHLAAFGGIVVPLAFLIEAPVIPLLSASTALSRDFASYKKIFKIMMWMGLGLTALHAIVTFTPLYQVIVTRILGCPEETVAPGRIGMAILLFWTWAIGFRRFHQGILIRFNATKYVGMGTLLRLLGNALIGLASWYLVTWSGIVVASIGVMTGVFFEAVFIGVVTHSVIESQVKAQPAIDPPLSSRQFAEFFLPLTLTSILDFMINPAISAAVSRMPMAIQSLAILSPIQGLSFMLRSPGFALTEIVIAMTERKGSKRLLRSFVTVLALASFAMALLLLFTPLREVCFRGLLGFKGDLVGMAAQGMVWMLPAFVLVSFRSLYQGTIVHYRHTRDVTIGTICYLIGMSAALYFGVRLQIFNGIVFFGLGLSLATLLQVLWLRFAVSRTGGCAE